MQQRMRVKLKDSITAGFNQLRSQPLLGLHFPFDRAVSLRLHHRIVEDQQYRRLCFTCHHANVENEQSKAILIEV
jgi:hypothetical protein